MDACLSRGIALTALVLAASLPARAQDTGDGFLFKPPAGSLTIRGGFDHATAGGDLFSFVTDELTLTRGDFIAVTVAADVAVRMTPRVDAVFGIGISHRTAPSEFRHWEDNNNQPIEQTTTFERVPLTASVKLYLAEPGRAVGRFAWIPSRYAPYVGAGGGVLWYRFQQTGDFIDFQTTRVFGDTFNSTGWAPAAQGFVGTDVSLTPRVAVTGELRYQWAKSALGRDFAAFDRIDLSGFAVTGGITVR
jgi:hypothetical protein